MSLQNKRFQNIDSQEVVSIMGDNGVFYNLSNGANIKKDIFFQKYSEMLDPTSFFDKQSAAGLSSLAEKIKTVDSSKAIDGDFAPQVKYKQDPISEQLQAPQEYREMLIRRFENEQAQKNLSQYKVYDNDDEAAADFERRNKQPQPPQRQRQPQYQEPQQFEDEEYYAPQEYPSAPSPSMPPHVPAYVSPEEEAFRFFRSFKKVYPIKLTVDFDERIAEPNFIKMMAVNYEGDIIKFYTKEFMARIYNDPGFLENKIYEKLRALVFEEEQVKQKKPRVQKPKPVPVKSKPTPRKRTPKVQKEDSEQEIN